MPEFPPLSRSKCTSWKATRSRRGEVTHFKVKCGQQRWWKWRWQCCHLAIATSTHPLRPPNNSSSHFLSRCLPAVLQSLPHQHFSRGQVTVYDDLQLLITTFKLQPKRLSLVLVMMSNLICQISTYAVYIALKIKNKTFWFVFLLIMKNIKQAKKMTTVKQKC